MHELHLVGFTADHDGLIFSTKKGASSGAYVVGIDDALFAALEEARRMALAETDDAAAQAAAERVRALRPTQRSNLSVRDIQSRLRSGKTLAEVAAEAGTDEDWVARFAAPVLAEQAAVVERAMEFTFTTPRKGPSSRPLGEAVRWNLRDKGVSVDAGASAAGWSAFQIEPGQWAIRFTYTSRGRTQVAEWEIDLEEGELTGRNRLATDLAYVEPGAKRRRQPEAAPPPPPPPPPAPKKATSGRKGTPARTTTARAQAAKASSTKAAANRATAAKAAASGRAKQPSARSGAAGSGARRGTVAANQAGQTRRRSGSGGGASAGRASTDAAVDAAAAEKASAAGFARFPAPRPAAGRPGHVPPSTAPSPRSQPAARASKPQPASRPAPPSAPVVRPEAPAPDSTLRRVAPPRAAAGPTADARPMPATASDRPGGPGPERPFSAGNAAPERPVGPGNAWSERPVGAGNAGPGRPVGAGNAGPGRPLGAGGTGPERAAAGSPGPAAGRGGGAGPEGPRGEPTGAGQGASRSDRAEPPAASGEPGGRPESVVRRLPTPAAAATSRRAERDHGAATLRSVPDLPAPEPEPEPPATPPRPPPATVRPVGGGDGRPTILIIDADRAGDRRRS